MTLNTAPATPAPATAHPPRPIVLVIEAYQGIRLVYPTFFELHLPTTDFHIVETVEEAEDALKDPAIHERVAGFITHGIAGDLNIAQLAVQAMDKTLGRTVPYVILTGAPEGIDAAVLPRKPIAVVEKGLRGSLPDCLKALKPYMTAPQLAQA